MRDKTAIFIPIRMGSTRLPGKFHLDIEGVPMVIRVLRKALETGIRNVFVAVDHKDHFELIKSHGGNPIMTSIDHQSGTDRVYEALTKIDENKEIEYIVNLQGDLPFIDPKAIVQAVGMLMDDHVDISTLAVKINDPYEINDPNVVKIAMNSANKALYFSRLPIPYNSLNYYHHLGLYAYKRNSLIRFVNSEQTMLEKCEKLEQLRALEKGMTIIVKEIDSVPISVDTEDDLIKAREYAKSEARGLQKK